jgi:hypothetical protein
MAGLGIVDRMLSARLVSEGISENRCENSACLTVMATIRQQDIATNLAELLRATASRQKQKLAGLNAKLICIEPVSFACLCPRDHLGWPWRAGPWCMGVPNFHHQGLQYSGRLTRAVGWTKASVINLCAGLASADPD